jgi:hypothetical protein
MRGNVHSLIEWFLFVEPPTTRLLITVASFSIGEKALTVTDSA